jgi:hypothetical protein
VCTIVRITTPSIEQSPQEKLKIHIEKSIKHWRRQPLKNVCPIKEERRRLYCNEPRIKYALRFIGWSDKYDKYAPKLLGDASKLLGDEVEVGAGRRVKRVCEREVIGIH